MKIEKLNSVYEWREDCHWKCMDQISKKLNELIDSVNEINREQDLLIDSLSSQVKFRRYVGKYIKSAAPVNCKKCNESPLIAEKGYLTSIECPNKCDSSYGISEKEVIDCWNINNEIKNCPFCRSAAFIQPCGHHWEIGCNSDHDSNCIKPMRDGYSTKQEAINAWNTRA